MTASFILNSRATRVGCFPVQADAVEVSCARSSKCPNQLFWLSRAIKERASQALSNDNLAYLLSVFLSFSHIYTHASIIIYRERLYKRKSTNSYRSQHLMLAAQNESGRRKPSTDEQYGLDPRGTCSYLRMAANLTFANALDAKASILPQSAEPF